jgi:hypothetical protein
MSHSDLRFRPGTSITSIVVAALLITLLCHGHASADSPAIDPKTDALLQQMSKSLADAKNFSFDSSITVETVLDNGHKVQTARTQHVIVRRPDGAVATVTGDNLNLNFVYDGKQALLYNLDKPAYALVDSPPTLDATFDMLANDYGLVIPLADLLSSDSYHALTEHIISAQDLGIGYVNETKCHHLAFRQDSIDWQIWIDQGDVPTPRKIVITYKLLPQSPEFTAIISNWNLAAQPPADAFTITPPANVTRSDLIKVPTTTQPAPKP